MPREQLTEKYRPRKLDDFVGLTGPRAILATLIADPWPSAWFFVGESGTGKTSMALAIGEAIGAEVHQVPSRKCDLKTVGHLWNVCHYTPIDAGFHLVIVDEADQMTQPAQLAFLTDLEKLPPQTIYIFTANSTGLHARFMSRCRLIRFDTNGSDEAAVRHLARVWKEQNGKTPAPDFAGIYCSSDRNLRTSLMNLEMLIIDPTYEVADVRSATEPETPTRRPIVIPTTKGRTAALKAWETRRKKSHHK